MNQQHSTFTSSTILKKRFRSLIRLNFIAVFIGLLSTQSAAAQKIDFNESIRPILSNKCFACHGPDEAARESDLRLDTREGATDWVIDLDSPEESELILRIQTDDADSVMPPPKHGEPLTAAQQKVFLQWIKEGANYDKHWAYQKPTSPTVPTVDGFQANEIDSFVQAKLAELGMKPSGMADRHTIIRRLALDVTGLPPTLKEVDNFLADGSENAYEKMVDYYLAKPAYGERWASVWLDLARYADSAGYAEDRKRTIWAYRDYVIQSYNANMPFDQFTVEQIAGDLLESPTDDSQIATAFHRNTLTNSEGGTSDEEFRSAAVVDRTNTTMAVWMGTTMACAQCHTHKYDPITQAEYFQFYDFFNQTDDNDRPNEQPLFSIYTEADRQRENKLKEKLAATEALRDAPVDSEKFATWIAETKQVELEKVAGQFVRVDLPGTGKILSLAEIQVFSTDDKGNRVNVALKGAVTQSSTGFGGPPELANDGNTDGDFEKKSVTHTNSEDSPWWQVKLESSVNVEQISVWQRTDNKLHSRSDGFQVSILDETENVVWTASFPQAIPTEQVISIQSVPPQILELAKSETPLSTEQTETLRNHFKQIRNAEIGLEIAAISTKIANVKPTTTVPIMKAIETKKARTTKVQIRGNYLDTGETVSAGTPAVFHSLPADAPRDRLSLANWLVDKNNPLTARVVVNRYWENLFGVGIVATSEEFGAQGDLPTHKELLDWLAEDLMKHNWDTRRLVKQILMSATYRQSSAASKSALVQDPFNRYLARGPRIRLSAEMIRDQALAVSGLLSPKMYGRPVQPPQPKVGLKPAFSGATTNWTDSVGEDRYRRGIYTEWRRSAPYASMATFDVNSREVCEIRRSNTNTPLQALVTLNDPVYVEAAQALARRVTAEKTKPAEVAELAFRLCLIRKPKQNELDRIVALFEQSREHFTDNAEAAKQLATDPLNPPAANVDLVELAAWTTVANVLLNLDEMLMKP